MRCLRGHHDNPVSFDPAGDGEDDVAVLDISDALVDSEPALVTLQLTVGDGAADGQVWPLIALSAEDEGQSGLLGKLDGSAQS